MEPASVIDDSPSKTPELEGKSGLDIVSSDAPGDLELEALAAEEREVGSQESQDAEDASDQDVPSEDQLSDVDSELLKRVSSVAIGELPMPDATEFSVPLPPALVETDAANSEGPPNLPLASPPQIMHVSDILKPFDLEEIGESNVKRAQIAHLGLEAGLTGEMQATYLCLPPGMRTSRPVAQRLGDTVTYCISGRGLLWQNGWTFPFEATDCVGWKAGTGITHTIINDSNRDGSAGEDLVLITAHEIREGESYFHPLEKESQGEALWEDPPVQGELGPHPGLPSVSGSMIQNFPEPQHGYRPSNVINAILELEGIGSGELFANATSLSQETGLSGRIGCNFEVPPPGTRSSDPHAHSLEDELVFVISGSGLVWINGNVKPIHEGDAVGFSGGTGIAHNFINDSNADGTEGEPLILWIIGQNKTKEGDLVYYPLHIEEKSNSKRWWPDAPKYDLGPHNGAPQRPRKR